MGAVHEELAPPFVDTILSLGYDAKVWLHQDPFSKGDVFRLQRQTESERPEWQK